MMKLEKEINHNLKEHPDRNQIKDLIHQKNKRKF